MYSQLPAKLRAMVCSQYAGQLLGFHTFGSNLDLKLENMVVASIQALFEGNPQLKLIDSDTAKTAMELMLQQWVTDPEDDCRLRDRLYPQPLVSHPNN